MRRHAEGTKVSIAQSRAAIEDLVTKSGATRFATGLEARRAWIGFEMNRRFVRFVLTLPARDEARFTEFFRGRVNPTTHRRTDSEVTRLHENECRRVWRSLLLSIRAKLTAIDDGISTFDIEFMPYVVMPGGKTIGETILPQMEGVAAGAPLALLEGR